MVKGEIERFGCEEGEDGEKMEREEREERQNKGKKMRIFNYIAR